jgi:hypothetical protein
MMDAMVYIDKTSLAKTIDNVSEALLFSFIIDETEKTEIASFLVEQHFAPGAYANMFAPAEKDMKRDLVLFTGEKIKSNAGRCHVMGEEASRILRKLDVKSPEVIQALQEADSGIQKRIKESGSISGTYCCRTCSCALWLNLSAGGLNHNSDILKSGLRFLKQHREDKGTWKGFPYFYTLYVLNEIEPELVKDELQFASKSILRWINRKQNEETKYLLRRKYIGEAILNKVY